jgi:Skp family chaperone for outer membrane proteins
MKVKTMVLSCLASAVVLLAGYQYTCAQPKAGQSANSKIGVVNVRKVFRSCKRNAKYREQAIAEQSKIKAEEEKLSKEAEALEAGLKALKPGSTDYMTQYKELLQKRAGLEAQVRFNGQQRIVKDQRWTEQLYQEILKMTGEMAQQKGLELVLDVDEPEFPTASADELMMTLSTNKALYSGGCVNLTDEIVTRLDAQESANK